MTAPSVLALWLARDPATEARAEFLRVLVAARAAGRPVTLLDLRPPAVADDPPLTTPEQRWLDALERDGVAARPASAQALRAALRSHATVLCLSGRTRPCAPPLLVLDPALLEGTPDAALLTTLRAAGQVLPAAPPRVTA